jgi:hypothetical protein
VPIPTAIGSQGPRHIALRLSFLVALLPCVPAAGQETAPPEAPGHTANGHCGDCHVCPTPTAGSPCLRGCTRNEEQRLARELAAKQGPRIVILDDLENVYLPVPFDHAGHAEMAKMAGGCATCHHYTPEGVEHPACKTCHTITVSEGDIRKPGLKGAYHRQCMSCHREWSGETSCGACHQPKTSGAGDRTALPTADDLIGRMHPPIPEPDFELYATKGEGYEPSHVLFRHKEHIHRYGLTCAECHREDNCNRCHEEGKKHVQRVRTFEDHHRPCLDCHKDDACEACHFKNGNEPPPPFEHAPTDWPLARYHRGQTCRACHTQVPFGKLDHDCESCHSGFATGSFAHDLTGQRLNETHAAFDCQDCHPDGYSAPPSCTECHDSEDGITFPSKRPGELVPSIAGQ